MFKLFLVSLVLGAAQTFGIPTLAQAQSYSLAEFTGHSYGDTLDLLGGSSTKSNMMLFVNPVNCFTCELSIENYTSLARNHSLSITLFIEGESQSYADTIRLHNGWHFQVVGDPIRAYEKSYSVKAPPFFFLTDGRGRILAMDKIAGALTSIDTLIAILSRLDVEQTSSDLGSLSIIKRIPIHHPDGSPLTLSTRRSVLPFQRKGYAILDCTFRSLHLVDSTGLLTNSYDLCRSDGRATLNPTDFSWLIQDSTLLIFGTSTTGWGSPAMCSLDLTTRILKQMPINDEQVPKHCRIGSAKGFAYNRSALVTLLPSEANARLPEEQPTMAAIDSNGTVYSVFGKPDSVLCRYLMSRVSDDCIGFDSNHIYECQSPTRTLNIYDRSFRLIRHIQLDFGKTWFEFKRDLPSHPTMADWLELNSHLSRTRAVYPSREGRSIVICYAHAEYPPGETDPISPNLIARYYLHRIDDHGRWLDDHDIALPPNAKPFQIEGNLIAVQDYKDNHLDLVLYEAKKAQSTSALMKN